MSRVSHLRKDIMKSAGIPTAEYHVAHSIQEAISILHEVSWAKHGWVIKADGLALGKGVKVCQSRGEAESAVHELFSISNVLVIEEELQGEEVSWMAFL